MFLLFDDIASKHHIQDDKGENVNILGDDSVGNCQKKKVHINI